MHLVDKRFAGQVGRALFLQIKSFSNVMTVVLMVKAIGLGTQAIIGKVHMAALKFGDEFYNSSFTILDQHHFGFLPGARYH